MPWLGNLACLKYQESYKIKIIFTWWSCFPLQVLNVQFLLILHPAFMYFIYKFVQCPSNAIICLGSTQLRHRRAGLLHICTLKKNQSWVPAKEEVLCDALAPKQMKHELCIPNLCCHTVKGVITIELTSFEFIFHMFLSIYNNVIMGYEESWWRIHFKYLQKAINTAVDLRLLKSRHWICSGNHF